MHIVWMSLSYAVVHDACYVMGRFILGEYKIRGHPSQSEMPSMTFGRNIYLLVQRCLGEGFHPCTVGELTMLPIPIVDQGGKGELCSRKRGKEREQKLEEVCFVGFEGWTFLQALNCSCCS